MSKTIEGVNLPETVSFKGTKLHLNGVGIRKASVLVVKIKVYAAGLYLEKKSSDPHQILSSNQIKQVNMHFLRDVPAKKISNAWTEGFENNCTSRCNEMKPALDKLNAAMTDMKSGNVLSLTFLPDSLWVQVPEKDPVQIEGKEFQKIILSNWLGPKPPNEDLKEGMLATSL
jgi:hypothetical protein